MTLLKAPFRAVLAVTLFIAGPARRRHIYSELGGPPGREPVLTPAQWRRLK